MKADWEFDARLYLSHYPDMQAIEWVDPESIVRGVTPERGNESYLDFDRARRKMLLEARQTREITVTKVHALDNREQGFMVFVPIINQGEFSGFVGGVFRVDPLLRNLSDEIRERRQVQNALRENQPRFQAILDNTSAVVYLKDVAGRYLLVNGRYEELFHQQKDNLIGRTDFELFPKQMADSFRANDMRVIAEGKALTMEETARRWPAHLYLDQVPPCSTVTTRCTRSAVSPPTSPNARTRRPVCATVTRRSNSRTTG
ncbi:MAG: PAS domain-containing protein [Limisphaerales bacterium]